MYYTTPAKKSEGVKGYWCHSCYSEHRGEVIELEGMRVRKVTPNYNPSTPDPWQRGARMQGVACPHRGTLLHPRLQRTA